MLPEPAARAGVGHMSGTYPQAKRGLPSTSHSRQACHLSPQGRTKRMFDWTPSSRVSRGIAADWPRRAPWIGPIFACRPVADVVDGSGGVDPAKLRWPHHAEPNEWAGLDSVWATSFASAATRLGGSRRPQFEAARCSPCIQWCCGWQRSTWNIGPLTPGDEAYKCLVTGAYPGLKPPTARMEARRTNLEMQQPQVSGRSRRAVSHTARTAQGTPR